MKILHYLNQFFAQIGGEEKAGQEVLFIPGAVGAGAVIENTLKDHGIEYATLACGDNYFHEEEEKALSAIRAALEQFQPDIFLAGPAFNAGRYGLACAKVCSWVRDNWRIPAITGMHEDNPGTKEIGRHVFAIQTGASAASMQESLKRFSLLIERLLDWRRDCYRKFPGGALLAYSAALYRALWCSGLCARHGFAAGKTQR